MSSLAGVYEIPAIKHVVFVTRNLLENQGDSQMTGCSRQDRESFRNILRRKSTQIAIVDQPWTATTIDAADFLAVLDTQGQEEIGSSCCAFDAEELDLLAINLTHSLEADRHLSKVPEEDCIEVFI